MLQRPIKFCLQGGGDALPQVRCGSMSQITNSILCITAE
jgi:hypothetical protein